MSRLSPGTLLLGVFAVLFGLLGAYIVRKQLEQKPAAAAEAAPETITIPVAATGLPKGRKITLGDIAILRLTRKDAVKRGYTDSYMANTQQIIGRVLREELKRGETFDTLMLYPEGTGPNISEQLQPGYRAVTVAVERDAAVAGFANPGTFVDVFFRAEEAEQGEEPRLTMPLLEGVEVLAFNDEMFPGSRSAGNSREREQAWVTLAVTPEQAMSLKIVQDEGTLTLALRSPDDPTFVDAPGPRTLDELLNRPNNKHRIEVYRGHSLSQVQFRNKERTTPSVESVARNRFASAAPTPAETPTVTPAPPPSPTEQDMGTMNDAPPQPRPRRTFDNPNR